MPVPPGALLEQPTQLLDIHSSIVENSRQRAALELPMQRHRQRDPSVMVLHADMTPALARDLPASTFERFDEAPTGNDRQSGAHAGTGNLRRITPASSERPSSRSPST